MAINVEIKKVADDGRLVRYSFLSSLGEERFLTADREAERVWPDQAAPARHRRLPASARARASVGACTAATGRATGREPAVIRGAVALPR